MRKLFSLLVVSMLSAACGSVSPSAGEEAVLVYKPLLFGSGGCGPDVVKTGLQWVALSTDGVLVNVQPREQHITFDDLMTSDGVPLDFHAVVQYQITDSRKLVCDFGADDSSNGMGFFKRNLEQPLRTLVRNSVKKHGLNEMAINVSAAEEVDIEVTKGLEQTIASSGVPIKLIGLSLGRANPPDAIKHQRIATAEQEQRVNTEKQRKFAEDTRRAAEESRATADRAYNDKMGFNTEQYLALEQIKAIREVCGDKNCTFVTDKVTSLVNIKQ